MATKNGKQRKVSNSVRCWLDYNQVDRPLQYFQLPEDADNRQKKCTVLMRQALYNALMASADPDGTGITVGLERLSRKISRSLRTTKDLYADMKRLGLVTEHGRESGHGGRGPKIRHVHSLRASLFAQQLLSWGGEVRLIVTGGQRHSAVVSGGQFVAEANGGLGEWIPEVQSSGIYNKAEVQSSPIAEVQGSYAEVQGSHAEVQPSQGRGWHRIDRLYRKEEEEASSSTSTHHNPNQLAARADYKQLIERVQDALGETPVPPGSDDLASDLAGFLGRDGHLTVSDVVLFWYIKNEDYVKRNPKTSFNLGTITNQYEATLTAMRAANWSYEKFLAEPL